MLTDFLKNLNLEVPMATYSAKGVNFFVEVHSLEDYGQYFSINRDSNFVSWEIKPKYIMKKLLEKMQTDFSNQCNTEIPHN